MQKHNSLLSTGYTSLNSLPFQGKEAAKGFTLVELIVVITILAILGTIAFISLQGYSKDARDSTRISDLSAMKTSLELFQLDAGKYPEPTEGFIISYSGSEVWTQGTFGTTTFSNISKLDKIPKDPLTDKEYTYSVTKTKQEYQFAGIVEGDEVTLNSAISQTNAGELIATALVTGTYNGQIIKTESGTNCNILSLPSIISSEANTTTDLSVILTNKSLVFNGYNNLPTNYIASKYKTDGGFEFISKKVLVYDDSASCKPLYNPEDNTARIELLTNLKEAYSGTLIENEDSISGVVNIDLTDTSKLDIISLTLVNNDLGGNLDVGSTGGGGGGGGGGQTEVATFKWKNIFDNTYFEPYSTESRATQWGGAGSGWIAGQYSFNVEIKPIGTWTTGFRPTKLRIAHTDYSPGYLVILDSDGNTIVSVPNYRSGQEIDLNFSGTRDIGKIYLDSMNMPQAIKSIEFYTDSDLGTVITPPVETRRTEFTGNTYWQCSGNCYRDGTYLRELGPGMAITTILMPDGTHWAFGYKPTKMRVTYSGTNNNISLSLGGGGGGEYGGCSNYVSGADCNINVGSNILSRINLYGSDTMGTIVEKIEFYY